jgi:hypothetical protein
MSDPIERAEKDRLAQADRGEKPWRRWGTYLSERQWGTVREDYSASGDAWASFPHEHARSRAYRWGDDGLLGLSDDQGLLCFSVALWNGRDRLLKERLYGLTNPEGNHGEDVKECYYYVDGLPTASYMKGLYKLPQAEFPYQRLIDENRARGRGQPEFELTDTGIFDESRYFDCFVEYAKETPDDILIRLTIHNRGPEAAALHVLPTLWFRNTWSWKGGTETEYGKPSIRQANPLDVVAEHPALGRYRFAVDGAPSLRPSADMQWLFTDNVTNNARLYGGDNESRHVKDAFHDYVVDGRRDAVNPERAGTKCAAYYAFQVPAGGSVQLRLRLFDDARPPARWWGASFDETFQRRISEADAFYDGMAMPADRATLRQGAAGLIWSKQFYYYDVKNWLTGDPICPPPPEHRAGRNREWSHVYCRDVISMPDKWEYPWFAAWDLAFHATSFLVLDPGFARQQLTLLLREWYMHPNGQLPAYEYNFGDVNPPVHAWACRLLADSQLRPGPADVDFVTRVFTKLALNFTWWVNRKDAAGKNLFSGGFLGLDNIGVFDRSAPLPGGAQLEQADGTAWMAQFCAEMLRMSMALTRHDPAWEDIAVKFLRHFVDIRRTINSMGGTGLWDEDDGFYYDSLRTGDRVQPLKVRSIVGLLPMAGAAVFGTDVAARAPGFMEQVQYMVKQDPTLRDSIMQTGRTGPDGRERRRWLVALPSREQLERLLRYMFDEQEFLSPYGIRALSKAHQERPYVFDAGGGQMRVSYVPGESDSSMFGGNSNWRGPIWFPINIVLIEALMTYHQFYGDTLQVELPTGSGNRVTLREAAMNLCDRLLSTFRAGPGGHRPLHGGDERYARDPHWRDLVLFYEYFHGDNGRGCGASHQTGWTGAAVMLAWMLKRTVEDPSMGMKEW